MFVKGQPSANPKGRPRVENSLSDMIRKKLKEPHPEGMTREAFIAERLVKMAESEKDPVSLMAIDKILDRLEGKPKQVSEVEVTERKPLEYDGPIGAPDNQAD